MRTTKSWSNLAIVCSFFAGYTVVSLSDIIEVAFLKALVGTLFCQTTKPMVNGNCAVVGCTSSKYQFRLWGEKISKQRSGTLKKMSMLSALSFVQLSKPSYFKSWI